MAKVSGRGPRRDWGLLSSIEEVGDMGVLLSLCDPELLHARTAHHLAQSIVQVLSGKATGTFRLASYWVMHV